MGLVPAGSRKSIAILISLAILLYVGLITNYPSSTTIHAQDEPTDVPFPTAVAKTALPELTSNATSAATSEATAATSSEPTERPFPTAIAKTAVPEATGSLSSAATSAATVTVGSAGATAAATASLTADNAMATIVALQSENKDLQDKLAAAQGDKGATLYAVVIVVIGLLLAFAVFFGLKRSGK